MQVDVETPQILEWLVGGAIAFFSILFAVIWYYHRKQITDVETRMEKLENKVDELFGAKLNVIEKDLGIVQTDVKNLEDKVEAHNRIYETRLAELINAAISPLISKMDNINDKLS